jgi:hypothetical protein
MVLHAELSDNLLVEVRRSILIVKRSETRNNSTRNDVSIAEEWYSFSQIRMIVHMEVLESL